MRIQKLSILIPAFNEANTIRKVLQNLFDLKLYNDVLKEIILINDCPTDSTEHEIELFQQENPNSNILIFNQPFNQGKGAAIQQGIKMATGDYIIIQDADLELNPEDINLLLQKAIDENIDIVYGSRFLNKNHKNTSFVWHILGNGFLTKLCNLFSGYNLTDMMTCYKLIPSSIVKSIVLKENRFGFEPEITMKLSKYKQLKIEEVPISYDARNKNEGKKISYLDGIRSIYCILKYRFIN
jgi:glycosyltransferase involved in cell wall biosynthesis